MLSMSPQAIEFADTAILFSYKRNISDLYPEAINFTTPDKLFAALLSAFLAWQKHASIRFYSVFARQHPFNNSKTLENSHRLQSQLQEEGPLILAPSSFLWPSNQELPKIAPCTATWCCNYGLKEKFPSCTKFYIFSAELTPIPPLSHIAFPLL